MTASTGAKPHTCNQYDVFLMLINPKGTLLYVAQSMPVFEMPLAAQGIEALIGRDVLAAGILIYNGATKSFTLSY
jgi:hypothetical protein